MTNVLVYDSSEEKLEKLAKGGIMKFIYGEFIFPNGMTFEQYEKDFRKAIGRKKYQINQTRDKKYKLTVYREDLYICLVGLLSGIDHGCMMG